MTTKTLKIAGFYENRTGRWYVTEDRAWKVRIIDENEASVIRNSSDVYRLVWDTTYNVRERRAVSPGGPVHQDVVALVAEVRRIESQ